MKKNSARCFAAPLVISFVIGAYAMGKPAPTVGVETKIFHGIRPDQKNGRNGLLNPERGFRWENRIGSFKTKWAVKTWLGAFESHADDGLTMTLAYCELLDYCEMENIPREKIERLAADFKAVRQAGTKLILCFRYEMRVKDQKGPTLDIILSHIQQLAPLLRANMDIIAVLQTGFIGLYGEWHRSFHGLDKNPEAQEKVLRALLDVLPPDRKLVIRYPRHKNIFVKRVSHRSDLQPITAREAHTLKPEARIGFCDDGFMVGKNDAGTFAPRPSKDYDYMSAESLFLPMDGEFFWAWSRPYGVKKDDGQQAIRRLWEHHYTFFSYAHNHTFYEGSWAKEKYGARFSIDEWKKDPLDPEFLVANHLPVSDGYFEDAAGNPVQRTIFEYIRDHLGYRIELREAGFPRSAAGGKPFSVRVPLVNRGFAAPINPRPIRLVAIGADNTVAVIATAKNDVRTWYPCVPDDRKKLSPVHELVFHTESFPTLAPGTYKLGLWLPDPYTSIQRDARYAMRVANGDVPWWPGPKNTYGVNVLGGIAIHE